MEDQIALTLTAIGADDPEDPDYDIASSGRCEANLFRGASDWDDAALEIKWDASERVFTVAFRGTGRVSVPLENMLSKRVPLLIAGSSRCECGDALSLGDYKVLSNQRDFVFEGEFFCSSCRAAKRARATGFRSLIEKWVYGLKKIEVKADGLAWSANSMAPKAVRLT